MNAHNNTLKPGQFVIDHLTGERGIVALHVEGVFRQSIYVVVIDSKGERYSDFDNLDRFSVVGDLA